MKTTYRAWSMATNYRKANLGSKNLFPTGQDSKRMKWGDWQVTVFPTICGFYFLLPDMSVSALFLLLQFYFLRDKVSSRLKTSQPLSHPRGGQDISH